MKLLFDTFLKKNGLKHGDALSPVLFNFALKYVSGKVKEHGRV
jgi:hypothetical protein